LAGNRNERRDRFGVRGVSLPRDSDPCDVQSRWWNSCTSAARVHIARLSITHRGTCPRVLRSAEHLIVVLGTCPDGQGILLNSRCGGRR